MKADLETKCRSLQDALRPLGSLAVAFSGGVDSTLLLRVARDVLGDRVLAVTAASEAFPAAELEAARALAKDLGARHLVIETRELDLPGFRHNPPDRCYHCKKELFGRLLETARKHGIEHVADGSNADDAHDYRPGARAAAELGVRTPLRDAGLTKADIRALSRRLGLPTWDKPAYACLASRVPYGAHITRRKLRMVERAEQLLRDLGFRQCRVRHHGHIARIEVEPERVPELAAPETARSVVAALKDIGFRYVALDLEGYRTGSLNEALPAGEGADGD